MYFKYIFIRKNRSVIITLEEVILKNKNKINQIKLII